MAEGVDFKPYSYVLPKERIAQRPCYPAEAARMLVVDRRNGEIADMRFEDIASVLGARDRLVFNDTRVIPARLFGTLDTPGRGAVELLLLERISDSTWVCLGKPLKKIRACGRVRFNADLWCEVIPEKSSQEFVTVEFKTQGSEPISKAIATHGTMPIPPYIRGGRGDAQDLTDYQTIFARHPGSVAAPTASLHFSPELMERISAHGINVSKITLHVGSASFLPVIDEQGELRAPGSERFCVSEAARSEIGATRDAGGRVIAVGTTVVRALESSLQSSDIDSTQLFITPGYQFRWVDALVTNFHQPGTTHLLLVESLLGRALLDRVYQHALANDYRFLS